jgi:hypothetical protein
MTEQLLLLTCNLSPPFLILNPDFALSVAASRTDAVEIEIFTYQIGSVKNKENRGLPFVVQN